MKLSELIAAERVIVPLESPTAAGAAEALVARLETAGVVQDPGKLRSRVGEERGEDIVAMGDRALLMHYRTDAVQDLVVALGIAPLPVKREMGGGESMAARIVLVIVAPPRLAARYLQVLSAFARALSNPEVVEALHTARSAEELVRIPVLSEYSLPEHLTVRDIMTEGARTTTPDTPLREAANEIARAGINALPVVEADGLLVGMLSERELMRHLLGNYLQGGQSPRAAHGITNARRSVRDAMTRQVLCVAPDQPLAEIASTMTNKDVEGVPVVSDGRVVGFLTRGDIIRKLIGT
ncbi:MAG: CBS domain-containing protein [Gemmatimonadaceae bacterium]|nr:CBS domain-containing protein [Gemmatimonadaceae bacterium]MDQ3520537.1 CBS domain-containing protein [Gemmatimonadota bacterium]